MHQIFKESLEIYGYLFLFFWTFLEGEAGLILAGYYAFEGTLALPGVMATALAGSFLGDQFYFYLGRWKGKRILGMFVSLERKLKRALVLIEKYGSLVAFISRYTYGLRIILPIILGMTNLSKKKFLILNLVSATIWAIAFSLAGYLFGKSASLLIDDLERYEPYILLCLLLFIGCMWAAHFLHFWWRSRRSGAPGDGRETVTFVEGERRPVETVDNKTKDGPDDPA